MNSKLVKWGRTRRDAIRRMRRALEEYDIAGVQTTIPFCHFVMEHEAFTSGVFSTHFVDQHFTPERLLEGAPMRGKSAGDGATASLEEALAVGAVFFAQQQKAAGNGAGSAAGSGLSRNGQAGSGTGEEKMGAFSPWRTRRG
ncbi:MAG: hypothetical protein RIE53_13585 [Rhodothermales bacterium]